MTQVHGHSLTSHQPALPGGRERGEPAAFTSHSETCPRKLQASTWALKMSSRVTPVTDQIQSKMQIWKGGRGFSRPHTQPWGLRFKGTGQPTTVSGALFI